MKRKVVKLLCLVVYFRFFLSLLDRVLDRTLNSIELTNLAAIPCLLAALAACAVLAELTVNRGIWPLLTLVYFRCFLFAIDWALNRFLSSIALMNIVTIPCVFVAFIASVALAERTASGLRKVSVR